VSTGATGEHDAGSNGQRREGEHPHHDAGPAETHADAIPQELIPQNPFP
jgi:hypothetical protein